MSSYPKRVAENILPLSNSNILTNAFSEWYFTDNVIDHEVSDEECELCNQEDLRYHFEIRNRLTSHRLWVGSSCILKFDVNVYHDGVLLDAFQSKKKLNDLKQQMRFDSCLNSLKRLAGSEKNEILTNALNFYTKNGYLTPKFSFVVFWRLNKNNIDHSPSFFKVSLKNDKYKSDLREMPNERVHIIWPALTSAQRKIALELGHTAPPII